MQYIITLVFREGPLEWPLQRILSTLSKGRQGCAVRKIQGSLVLFSLPGTVAWGHWAQLEHILGRVSSCLPYWLFIHVSSEAPASPLGLICGWTFSHTHQHTWPVKIKPSYPLKLKIIIIKKIIKKHMVYHLILTCTGNYQSAKHSVCSQTWKMWLSDLY